MIDVEKIERLKKQLGYEKPDNFEPLNTCLINDLKDVLHTYHLDYEDFVGFTYSTDEKKIFNKTISLLYESSYYSMLKFEENKNKEDYDRMMGIMNEITRLKADYPEYLEEKKSD